MKKDFLKDFIEKNRTSFDEYEPASDVLNRIQSKLGMNEPYSGHKKKIIRMRYWWAAAAMLLLVVGFLLFHQQGSIQTDLAMVDNSATDTGIVINEMNDTNNSKAPTRVLTTTLEKTGKINGSKKINEQFTNHNTPIIDADVNTPNVSNNTASVNDWRQDIQGMRSSSARLAAVLTAGKEDTLSAADLRLLATTMNRDENSNVRLAAFEVLSRQQNQPEVKNWIIESISQQDDPIVQMELLAQLSPDEVTDVRKDLLAITQDPTNIEAVRDQAYAVLLRSGTKF